MAMFMSSQESQDGMYSLMLKNYAGQNGVCVIDMQKGEITSYLFRGKEPFRP